MCMAAHPECHLIPMVCTVLSGQPQLAGDEDDLSPYLQSPGVRAAVDEAVAAGVSDPVAALFGACLAQGSMTIGAMLRLYSQSGRLIISVSSLDQCPWAYTSTS